MLHRLPFGFIFLLLASCVTINVYFPAAAADTAARTIVRDVLGTDAPDASSEPEPETEQPTTHPDMSAAPPRQRVWLQYAEKIIDVLISPARAGADININTPVISQLRASLKKRQPKLNPYFKSGALGLSGDGLVKVHDQGAVPLKDRNRVKKFVADDNRDRNALYKEIAKANKHPEWENKIKKTFAKVWVEEFPKGTWYETSGKWRQK